MTQEKMSSEKIVNGVNVDNLFRTVVAVKGNPTIAKFNFRAKNRWINGGSNRTTVNEFYGACQTHSRSKPFEYVKDEPPILLGNDQGANPVEYALAALAGCLTTSLIYHAAAQGIKIEQVESKLQGDLDLQGFFGLSEKIRNGYEHIDVTFKIKSDAPKEKLQELVELAQKRSPVFDMISNPTPVHVALEAS
ncbi:MAG TPA: OsmC family protein [Nitrososphaera sp.]|nr:OsmC family protein [Nitrososphaera sp.]